MSLQENQPKAISLFDDELSLPAAVSLLDEDNKPVPKKFTIQLKNDSPYLDTDIDELLQLNESGVIIKRVEDFFTGDTKVRRLTFQSI